MLHIYLAESTDPGSRLSSLLRASHFVNSPSDFLCVDGIIPGGHGKPSDNKAFEL